jgi:ATP-dependent DNA helicase RecG
MASVQKSIRLSEEVIKEIETLASNTGSDFSSLARDLLVEAVKMRKYPGVTFTDGTVGRRAGESLYYDETPLPRLNLSDIDFGAFENFLDETGQSDLGVDPQRLMRNWRLLSGDHPTLAGVILFGRKPQQHLPHAQVNAARIPGADVSVEPLDMKDITGRLLDVVDQVQRFLRLHLPVKHEINGFLPENKSELPEEALREAVTNAVAHRDYTIRGPIRIFILDDRIEIHTPGRAPNTVDEAAMRAGVHVVRNPYIYARLSDAGLVTRAGSGIRRIIRLINAATGKDIGINLRDFEVLLTIPRKKSAR